MYKIFSLQLFKFGSFSILGFSCFPQPHAKDKVFLFILVVGGRIFHFEEAVNHSSLII